VNRDEKTDDLIYQSINAYILNHTMVNT